MNNHATGAVYPPEEKQDAVLPSRETFAVFFILKKKKKTTTCV